MKKTLIAILLMVSTVNVNASTIGRSNRPSGNSRAMEVYNARLAHEKFMAIVKERERKRMEEAERRNPKPQRKTFTRINMVTDVFPIEGDINTLTTLDSKQYDKVKLDRMEFEGDENRYLIFFHSKGNARIKVEFLPKDIRDKYDIHSWEDIESEREAERLRNIEEANRIAKEKRYKKFVQQEKEFAEKKISDEIVRKQQEIDDRIWITKINENRRLEEIALKKREIELREQKRKDDIAREAREQKQKELRKKELAEVKRQAIVALIWSVVFIGTVIVLGISLYMTPTIIAYHRRHHNKVAILTLNILLGWTFLGWVASLVWAVTKIEKELTSTE